MSMEGCALRQPLSFLILFTSMVVLPCHVTFADLPVHCLNTHVAGEWVLSLSAPSVHAQPKRVAGQPHPGQQCGHPIPDSSHHHFAEKAYSFSVKAHIHVNLTEPNRVHVLKQDGTIVPTNSQHQVDSTWTMVYDEAMELSVQGYRFLAFFRYIPKHQYATKRLSRHAQLNSRYFVSICDRTLVGWYHEDVPLPQKWGCFSATKVGAKPLSSYRYQWLGVREDYGSTRGGRDHGGHSDRDDTDGDDDDDDDDDDGGRHEEEDDKEQNREDDDENDVFLSAEDDVVPTSFDWRNVSGQNFVSPIRNQLAVGGDCGSCYAMSVVDAAEARIRILSKNKLQPQLSVQAIVSCSMYNQGCEGGYPYLAAMHGQDFGLVEDKCMPYVGKDTPCKAADCSQRYVVTNLSYVGGYYGGSSVRAMQQTIMKHGPIMITLMIPEGFDDYKGGVFVAPPGGSHLKSEGVTLYGKKGRKILKPWESVSHAVTAVGWGVDDTVSPPMPYWLMKGNIGTHWGEDGFFRIRRGTDECGVESMPSWLDVSLPSA